MSDIEKSVNEIVEDLKKKIDDISKAGNGADEESLRRINDIKQKAISVLNQASNKVMETAKNLSDSEEVQKGIEIVKVKSKELYDNALSRINELSSSNIFEEVKQDVEEVIEEVKKDVGEIIEKEEVKEVVDTVKEKASELSEKAYSTLKDWLKPEDK